MSQHIPISWDTCQPSNQGAWSLQALPGVPATLWLHMHGHRLSPVVPSTCCSPSNHLWVHLFLGHYREKAFTSSMDTVPGLLCLTAHMRPLRWCLSLLISLQCFNCMNWKLLL